MTLRSCLYTGQVYHKRTRPQVHVLRYSVFSLLLDIVEIPQLSQKLWLISHNAFNLFSFHDQDFGENKNESLTTYIERKLENAGIRRKPRRILLSCYPRVLGHAFNPLSIFYCLDDNDNCYAVVHEVHNTFGERHAYVLPVEVDQQTTGCWIHQEAEKVLFVSPFAHMGMHYKFRLNLPQERQVVVIHASDDQGLLITASYTAQRKVLSTAQLLKQFFKVPLLGAKVVAGIHWEALRLWVKKVPLYKHHPKRPT